MADKAVVIRRELRGSRLNASLFAAKFVGQVRQEVLMPLPDQSEDTGVAAIFGRFLLIF